MFKKKTKKKNETLPCGCELYGGYPIYSPYWHQLSYVDYVNDENERRHRIYKCDTHRAWWKEEFKNVTPK